jgi:hypothetical protein
VACYHNEGWRPTFYEQGLGVPESYYKSLRYIAAGNVKGLVELARTANDR